MEMQQAYDLKALAAELEKQGVPVLLNAAEESAKRVYMAFKEWLKMSAVLSENKYDDIVVPFIDQLDAIVLPQIDKIDKEVG